ncbi:hypothetical protein DW956_02455 [Phocaeicola vulgatus]|nr:hypothetical protein DW956_02455 [Phocaeicola vulgatus]
MEVKQFFCPGTALSGLHARFWERILSAGLEIVSQIHPDLAFVQKDAVTSLKTNVEITRVL